MLPSLRNIRTLVVDDSPLAVRAICACLQNQPAIQIAGTACDGVEALTIARQLRPDVVLLDLQMPGMNGLQVASRLSREFPEIIVFLVSSMDTSNLSATLSELGVHGIVSKEHMSDELPRLLQLARSR